MATGRLRAQPGHINHLCGSAYLPCGLPRCPRLPATSYNKWRFVSPGSRCEEGVGESKSDSCLDPGLNALWLRHISFLRPWLLICENNSTHLTH